MSLSLDALTATIDAFVQARRGLPAGTVTPETALLAEGLVDSFELVELIAQLGDALGLSLSPGELIPEDFETPAVLLARLEVLGGS